jgi:hypothetical protein
MKILLLNNHIQIIIIWIRAYYQKIKDHQNDHF